MTIKLLSESAINKIAAGEVVDRPLAVVKELVENSIDAGATSISVSFIRGGRTLISVSDNGVGIKKEELSLAVQRHATSKLDENALDKITFLGFRGEALPSIGSVSRMRIISRIQDDNSAWEISINGGEAGAIKPCFRNVGTSVEVRDLFCFTPSRLKFLKSEQHENASCINLVTRLALSKPHIEFKLVINDNIVLHVAPDDEARLEILLGSDFVKNTLPIQYETSGLKINGHISLPTFHNALSTRQYFYVNGRAIKDKLLIGAMRAAYANLIPSGRYPIGVLFINVENQDVDVNVHPTKSEVRFKDEQKIRRTLIDAVRHNLENSGPRYSTTTTEKALSFMIPPSEISSSVDNTKKNKINIEDKNYFRLQSSKENNKFCDIDSDTLNFTKLPIHTTDNTEKPIIQNTSIKHKYEQNKILIEERGILGTAKCQINKTYIMAEVDDGIIIIDQHAAHERLLLEQMKKQISDDKIALQYLLIPEIVELGNDIVIKMIEHIDTLKRLGIIIERNGIKQILVLALPSLLGQINIYSFISDIASHLMTFNVVDSFERLIEDIYGNIACKNSIKAGRAMNLEEMNALLRSMERTPFSGQCNHGRPTYVKLTVKDLAKIFERS